MPRYLAEINLTLNLRDETYLGTYIMGRRTVTEIGSKRMQLKDESEWFKIANNHPAIIEKEVYEQVQGIFSCYRHTKQKTGYNLEYNLRSKVICGCYLHTMSRVGGRNEPFLASIQ